MHASFSQSTHRLDDGEALAMLQALFLYQVLGAFQYEKNYRDLTNVFHGSLVQVRCMHLSATKLR